MRETINLASVGACTGCSACVSICPHGSIVLKMDNEGFLQPHIDDKACSKCHRCELVCPIITEKDFARLYETRVYAVINKDDGIRKRSSSGGVFYELARKILQKGGVVFGASFDENWNVVHKYVTRIEELDSLLRSKYVQSTIGEAFIQAKAFLQQGREVLFSGTSCQLAGLRSFLGKDYPNLFQVDVVCHGVPSPEVWRAYLAWAFKGETIISINFRNKDNGWKNFQPTFASIGRVLQEDMGKNLYFKGFLSNLYLRKSCYSCKFKTLKRDTDITLADYWGVEELAPDMFDNKGTSLVFVHSKKAEEILMSETDRLYISQQSAKDVVAFNKAVIESYKQPYKRKLFFLAFRIGGFGMAKYYIAHDPITIRIVRKFKKYLK